MLRFYLFSIGYSKHRSTAARTIKSEETKERIWTMILLLCWRMHSLLWNKRMMNVMLFVTLLHTSYVGCPCNSKTCLNLYFIKWLPLDLRNILHKTRILWGIRDVYLTHLYHLSQTGRCVISPNHKLANAPRTTSRFLASWLTIHLWIISLYGVNCSCCAPYGAFEMVIVK